MMKLLKFLPVVLLGWLVLGHGAHAACSPNPNANGIATNSFADNCTLPSQGLNKSFATMMQVPTNAALSTLVRSGTFLPTAVYRQGFAAPGDGGGMFYRFAAGACSLNAGAGDNGAQVPASGGGCWNADLSVLPPTVLAWGADPTGTNDSTTAFQNAATAICTIQGGGRLYVPPVTYKAHDINVTCPLLLFGSATLGTTIDYSAATTFGLQWQHPGFPNTQAGIYLDGGGLEHINFTYSGATATVYQVRLEGVADWHAAHVRGISAPNGWFIYGVNHLDFHDITTQFVASGGEDWSLYGDITGHDGSNVACTTSSSACTTRSDWVVFTDIDDGSAGGDTGMHIKGFFNSVHGNHFVFENAATGVRVECPAGLATNMSQCPHDIELGTLQVENFHNYGVNASDFIGLQLPGTMYLSGDATVSNNQGINLDAVNYISAAAVGVATIRGDRVFNSQGSCIQVGATGGVLDVTIIGTKVNFCNNGNTGAAAIDFINGSQFKVDSATLCKVDGASDAHPSGGVKFGNSTSVGQVINSSFIGCASRITDNSVQPYTITDQGNIGPGTVPSVSACGAGTNITGTDNSFLIHMGASGVSSCTITFGSVQPKQPNCAATFSSGSVDITPWFPSPSTTGVVFTTNPATTSAADIVTGTCFWN